MQEDWQPSASVTAAAARDLVQHHYAFIDDLVPPDALPALHSEAQAAYSRGDLAPAGIGGGFHARTVRGDLCG